MSKPESTIVECGRHPQERPHRRSLNPYETLDLMVGDGRPPLGQEEQRRIRQLGPPRMTEQLNCSRSLEFMRPDPSAATVLNRNRRETGSLVFVGESNTGPVCLSQKST